MMKLFLVILLVGFYSLLTNGVPPGYSFKQRTSPNIKVFHYDLLIEPFFPYPGQESQRIDLTFDGLVGIYFMAKSNLNVVDFDADNLAIHRLKLLDLYLGVEVESKFRIDKKEELLTVLANFKQGHVYRLDVDYSAPLSDQYYGFYYVNYVDEDRNNRTLVATVFENNKEPQMFPCISNNSNQTSTFNFTAIYPIGAKVFHNSLDLQTTNYSAYKQITRFKQSPLMPTYLFGFVAGNFTVVETRSRSGVLVRVASVINNSEYMSEPLENAAKAIDALEDYFNTTYPLEKLDNVDILKIRKGTAIESMGMIVYKNRLVYDHKTLSITERYFLRLEVAHEIVHHFLGNLVTLKDWTRIFIRESVASILDYRTAQRMFPKNKEAIRMEIADTLDYSLRLSSLANHTLINTENVTADGLFLSGALMIQMFEFTFGQEVFRQALILFVETHKYSSVDEFDFIRAFEKVTGNATLCGNLTIREFMLDFIDQLYYPVVAVTEVNQQIKLSQYSSNHTQSTRWNIPLFIHNINLNETHLYWLLKSGELCSNNNAPALSSRYNYIFNDNYVSFLRIHYSPKLHQNLMKEDLSKLDEVSQLGITQDFSAFENVNAGNLFLKLINDSNGRLSSQLTFFIIHHLGMKDAVFMNTNEYDLFNKLHIRQIETLLQHVVWEPSTDLRINNFNKAVLDYAITLDVGNVRKRLNDMFEEFRYNCTQKDVNLETCNQLPPNLRQSVYCAGVVANETQQMFLIAYLLALQQNLESHSYLRHEVKILEYNLYCIENLTRLVELIKMTQFQNMPDLLDQLSQQLKNVPDIYDGTSKQVMEIDNTDDNEGQCEVQELFLKIFFHAIVDAWQNTNKLEETKKLAVQVRPFINPPLLEFFDSEIEEIVPFAINDSLSDARKETRWLFDAEVPETRPAWMTKRLEVNVKNITYDLLIEPHFSTNEHVVDVQKEMTIDGHVDIQFTTTAKMDQISLNSHRQMIQNIVILIGNQTIVPTIKRDYYETFLHIEFGRTVEANTTVRISIDHVSFISTMSDGKQDGLILSKHYNPLTNSTNYLFTTQLSGGTNARTLTVCFDIPNYKAIWRVRIRHFRELVPISNAEVETSSVWSNDKMETVFKATTPIASMFFSVALGQLQSINGVTKNGIPVSVYAPPGYQVYAQVALETSITALDYFDSILNVPYQSFSTKLDVLAFKNFYGAMENVALVVLNDHYVLYDQYSQTLAYKQQLVTKIVHELGHQWFGDLISSKYWEQMFLGESFARFLEPWFFDHIEGTGKSKRFESTEIGLRFDEQNLLPVVDTPEKTVENRLTPFLMPVFNRPAALFVTLQHLLGDQAFWKAVQAYVNENKFGVAEDVDLSRAFDQAINSTNVTDWNNQILRSKEFLDPFVKQVSFPVIFVETNKTGGVKIWQQPYHSLNESNSNSTFNYYFNLPLFLMNKNGTVTQNGWLTNNTRIFNDSNLLLVNPGRIAYARVLYDDFSWSKILANFSDFDEITRAVLLTDTYSFVKQGTLKWSRLFGLLKNLQNENSALVWSYGTEIFLNLLQKLKTQPEELNKLKALIKHAVDGRGEIRFESWSTSDANIHFVYLQNELRDPEFVRHAAQFSVPIYNECLGSIHGLSECFEVIPEHRSTVLCAAIQEHEQLFEPRIRKLLIRYGQMSATDPFLRDKAQPFAEAIGCLTDSNLLRFYINATIHRMFAPFEDLILKSISQKDETQMHLYTYFIEYFQTITNSDTFDLYVSVMAFDWSTEEQLQQISDFNLPNLLTVDQQKTMNTTIQQVRRNIEWMNKNFIGKHDIL